MTAPVLTGWVSFWTEADGTYWLSDSYPTERECRAAYGSADVSGFINLALIPPEAIKAV